MKLTIFTPAYNRAGMLPRLFQSLLRQTSFDFEWLIVDDGSTDETEQLVSSFVNKASFPVRYVYKENGGKHTAHNVALKYAQGKWFFCVDSDDYLADGAVDIIIQSTRSLADNQGIIAYKEEVTGKRLSGEFPRDVLFAGLNSLAFTYGCTGEFSLIFPTALLQKYPFPVFEGEKFVTESVVYDRIEQDSEMLLLRKTVTICEYQTEGYSQNANRLMRHNPLGYCLYFLQRVDISPTVRQKLVCAGKYWCFRWIANTPELRYSGKHKALIIFSIPLGALFRIYYRFVRGI